jgi:hypothetical protein
MLARFIVVLIAMIAINYKQENFFHSLLFLCHADVNVKPVIYPLVHVLTSKLKLSQLSPLMYNEATKGANFQLQLLLSIHSLVFTSEIILLSTAAFKTLQHSLTINSNDSGIGRRAKDIKQAAREKYHKYFSSFTSRTVTRQEIAIIIEGERIFSIETEGKNHCEREKMKQIRRKRELLPIFGVNFL